MLTVMLVLATPAVAEEGIALARARAAQQLAESAIGSQTQSSTLEWSAAEVDDEGRPVTGFAIENAMDGMVVELKVSAAGTGATPAVYAMPPDGAAVPMGDVSPTSGEADAWLRLHALGDWNFFLVADKPGVSGTISIEMHMFAIGEGVDPKLGTLLQTEVPKPPAATLAAGIHAGALEDGDERLDDGAPVDFTKVHLAAGERLSLAAVPSAYDVHLVVVAPDRTTTRAESSRVAQKAALIDLKATEAGEHTIGIFAEKSSDRGAYTLIRHRVSDGTTCDVLGKLEVADAWALEGVDHPSDTRSMRKRSLVDRAAWAEECEVAYFAMDLGASCAARNLDTAASQALYDRLVADLRACHTGWDVKDDTDGLRAAVVATRGGIAHEVARFGTDHQGYTVRVGTDEAE